LSTAAGARNQALPNTRHTPASREAEVDQDRGGSVGLLADLDQTHFAEAVDLLHVVAARHNVDVAHAVAGAVEAEAAEAVMAPATLAPCRRGGRSERGGAERGDAGKRE